jgi:YspA, cpYpsA-related SLOG family
VLDGLEPMQVSMIIHGAAPGADTLTGRWAELRRIPVEAFPPDWEKRSRAAGPIRNARMLAEGKPDLEVAFPGGHGTANMVKQARAAGVEVSEVSEVLEVSAGGRAAV